MKVTTTMVSDGLRFECTASGKSYRSLNYHRPPGGTHKTTWSVQRSVEFRLFCDADDNEWSDGRGLWSFKDGARSKIGEGGERIAFFPRKVASADDWHGYPLALSPVRRPSAELTRRWLADGLIRFVTQKKMLKGKL